MSDDRLRLLERSLAEMRETNWRFQGRLNALELISTLSVLNFAQTQENPFEWVQFYTENMRYIITRTISIPDETDPADRLKAETKDALEEFLEQLLVQAGQLKGAPKR